MTQNRWHSNGSHARRHRDRAVRSPAGALARRTRPARRSRTAPAPPPRPAPCTRAGPAPRSAPTSRACSPSLGAIEFSSFGVLAYYAIANASAWTLTEDEGRSNRLIPAGGLAGCLVLVFALPLSSVVSGAAVLAFGAAAYGLRRALTARRP